MADIDQPTIAEVRALAQLRNAAKARVRERIVLDYFYDHRHLRRVRKALKAEGMTLRFGIHEQGVWVRIVAAHESKPALKGHLNV